MKKIPDSSGSSKDYEGIQLYRDDIELILFVLQENQFVVEIKDEEFEYDSLDELIEKRGITPTYFGINAELKYERHIASVSLSFKRKRVHLSSYGLGHKEPQIVFARIKDIFDSKFSKPYKILNPWVWYFLMVPSVTVYWPRPLFSEISKMPPWLHTICILSLGPFILSSLYRHFRHQVILKRKHEGGFFKRNADKIWLLVIGTVFGIILKLVFDAIWKAI